MGLFSRRLPLYGRPLPFAVFSVLAFVGLYWGVNWDWQWSLQTGHIFILIVVPHSLLSWEDGKAFLLAVGLVSLAALYAYGTMTRGMVRRMLRTGDASGWSRPRFRFYPLTMVFGLFVLYYGLVFLFDASVYGDRVRGASVAFVYLDYAGLLDRPFVSLVGLALVSLGLACSTWLAFARGLGLGTGRPSTPAAFPAQPPMAPRAPAA